MSATLIDLRSDTVTEPCNTMRQVMAAAPVGDDVTGDDPTVIELEQYCANLLGKEAGMYAPSGVQANLTALMSHCERGDEYVVGQNAHTYKFEGGGAAVLGSIVPQPLDMQADGSLDLNQVKAVIKPDDYHFAKTRLLCLENTTWGKPLPMDYLAKARAFVDEHGLNLHLDGARMFNAAIHHQVEPIAIAQYFDSVSICLSKGLGAPVGSVLVGNSEFITKARRVRKMLGGGMRQAGIIAAGGLFAVKNNVSRLADDHANAEYFAKQLQNCTSFKQANIEVSVQTNMVFFNLPANKGQLLADFLAARNVRIYPGDSQRLVVHMHIDKPAIDSVVAMIAEFVVA